MKTEAIVTKSDKSFIKESVIIVEKVGGNVSGLNEGDHVVLSFSYCGNCESCLTGNSAGCEKMLELNFSGYNQNKKTPIHNENGGDISQFFGQSSFAKYTVCNQKNVVKVKKDVDLKYLGPLGCGFLTGSGTVLNTLKVKPGSSITIFGTGSVGLSAIMAAKIAGCTTIIAVDVHENRLELSKELGATHVINSKKNNIEEKIKEITGNGTNYSLETTGVPEISLSAIRSLYKNGECAMVAVGNENITFNITNELVITGKKIYGVIEGDSVPKLMIPKLVEFFINGLFPIDKISEFYNINDIEVAFEDSKRGKTIKPILLIDENY